MRTFLLVISLFCIQGIQSQEIQLVELAKGFSLPVDISHAGDERLFITEKAGLIRILYPDGSKAATPFLDIKNRVNSAANERGLLGLSFHPDYKENGYFFVNYTNSSGHTTISRFSVTSDPNVADAASEKIILVVNQPFNNHNAGDLAFGPDGYLYVGLGDGGSGGDPGNRSQNPQNLLGKMLRLDIDTEEPYRVPADNPWVNNPDTLPEIWAFGLRNPWRYSFDRQTGDLWIGDVGQNKWEEINFIPAGTPAINYGWRCYEGYDTYNTTGCKDISFYTPPVFAYRNPTLGCSVTGGFVYRGPEASRYQGQYLFADYCSGRFWSVQNNGSDGFEGVEIARFNANQFVTFGEDYRGSLLVAGIGNGTIYAVRDPKCTYLEELNFIDVKPVSCHELCDGALIPQDNVFTGTYSWSTGSSSAKLEFLCPGEYTLTVTDTIGCVKSYFFSIDTVPAIIAEVTKQGDVLFATSNFSSVQFQWYKNGEILAGETQDTLKVQGSGTYFVEVTNEFGCIAISEDFEILDCSYLENNSVTSVSPVSCQDSCDANITLTLPNTDIRVLWNTGDTLPELQNVCPGNYIASLTDTNGCTATLITFVSEAPALTVELNVAGQSIAAFSNQEVTYQWYKNGEVIPGATNQIFDVITSGEYYVVVTNQKGCMAQSFSITITHTTDPGPRGPSIRCRTLSGEGIQFLFDQHVRCAVAVFDLSGKLIFRETSDYQENEWNKIQLFGHQDGYYILQLQIGTRQYAYKVFLKF